MSSSKPRLFEIEDQRGDGRIESGQQFIAQPREVVEVRVPCRVDDFVFVPKNGNQWATGFEQPTAGQCGLSEQRHAVLLATRHRFAADIERIARFCDVMNE